MKISRRNAVDTDKGFALRVCDRAYREVIEAAVRMGRRQAGSTIRYGVVGRGIGTTVLREIMERARILGVAATLQTQKVNLGAASLDSRLGRHQVGETETHILFEWKP